MYSNTNTYVLFYIGLYDDDDIVGTCDICMLYFVVCASSYCVGGSHHSIQPVQRH